MRIWNERLQYSPRERIPSYQAHLITAFVLAQTPEEKVQVLRQTGIAGMEQVIQLMDKDKRLALQNNESF